MKVETSVTWLNRLLIKTHHHRYWSNMAWCFSRPRQNTVRWKNFYHQTRSVSSSSEERHLFWRVIVIFRRKSFFFARKIFNSVVTVFFVLKLPWTRRVQVCRDVGVLYDKCVGCQRGSEAEVVGSNPAIGHIFYVFLKTRSHVLSFDQQKQGFSRQIYGFFLSGFFFHSKINLLLTWLRKRKFFVNSFSENEKNFLIFLKK